MDWVYKPRNYKDLYGILQLLGGSYLNNFQLKTLKLGLVALHSVKFQLKCLDFQSNRYKKLVPVISRFCDGLCNMTDHSVGARDELHESEASEASVFCFDNASPEKSCFVDGLRLVCFISLCRRVFEFPNATRRE